MEKNSIYLLVVIIGTGFISSKKWVFAGLDNRYNSYSVLGGKLPLLYDHPGEHRIRQHHEIMQAGIRKGMHYSIVKKDTLATERIHANETYGPIDVTTNGNTCILFGVKRIIITYNNQTQLDLTNTGVYHNVDTEDSNCNEENATLSLKFVHAGNMDGLMLRFLLIKSYYKLSVHNWFKLQSVQVLFNGSVQAVFSTTRIFAPISYSYHCEHVSSLQKYNGLLMHSSTNGSSRLWDVTFLDFQIQGFNIEEGKFAYAKDCTTYFSPAILMGLVMSLILLLVLAYALHMLIHLKSIDKHYQRKSSVYFPKTTDDSLEDEKEPLRGTLQEYYELRQHECSKLHMQHCASVSH
ncbi:V-type proton ATPase subunit S1-like protein [Spea bombifrons]|uniref:V-type proton ATPase subunit S1-like protein n=1 Tax=Spea bombifrons TaxID=233779 RepID=UPI002349BB5B|nr:V-type proton ATPase subunit S1-like protein [Spea bombifrons]